MSLHLCIGQFQLTWIIILIFLEHSTFSSLVLLFGKLRYLGCHLSVEKETQPGNVNSFPGVICEALIGSGLEPAPSSPGASVCVLGSAPWAQNANCSSSRFSQFSEKSKALPYDMLVNRCVARSACEGGSAVVEGALVPSSQVPTPAPGSCPLCLFLAPRLQFIIIAL